MNRLSWKLILIALLGLFVFAACKPVTEPYGDSPSQGFFQAESTATESIVAPDVTPLASATENSLSAYPAPEQVSIDATLTLTPDVCMNVGQLTTFEDPVAGYRVQYPAEATLMESPKVNPLLDFASASFIMRPQCYNQQCWGSNRINIGVMYNTQQLTLQEFVNQMYKDYLAELDNDKLQSYRNGVKLINVAGTQALQIDQDIVFNQPVVFIPYSQDRILRVGVSTPGSHPMPPFDPPCEQMLKLFDEFLNHIEFLPAE
jgi:hypothetical protein